MWKKKNQNFQEFQRKYPLEDAALTHLWYNPAMMAWDNFEGHTRPASAGGLFFSRFISIPQSNIVVWCTKSKESLQKAQEETALALSSSRKERKITHTAICRPSGNAATHETAPELIGFRSVFNSFGTPFTLWPNCRVSHTSTVLLRRPA